MKTNLIEITVSGRTGSGKSEVLEVIKNALEKELGFPATHIKIAGFDPTGAIKESKTTGQSANTGNTVFVLYEQNVSGEIKTHD